MKKLIILSIVLVSVFGCKKDDDEQTPNPNNPGTQSKEYIYFQSNEASGNRVFGYMRSGDSLIELQGSPFATGDIGFANPMQALGPSDGDYQMRITDDGKFLLSVNEGSNTISVMNISAEGALTPVAGSPFSSSGLNPVSIDIRNEFVYVANKSIDTTSGVAPNYSVFTLNASGVLSPVSGSTIETSVGSSPANAYLSNDGKFLFGTDFLGFMLNPAVGTLRSFAINGSTGSISTIGSPQMIPDMGGALGLWQHPSSNHLYVGFPVAGKVGIYDIDPNSGALSFTNSVPSGPLACWIKTNSSGSRMYVLNSGENSVSIFNTTSPGMPATLGKFTLKIPGPLYTVMGMSMTTSQPFSFHLSDDESILYVLNQHTNPDFSIGNFNYLHILKVDNDGMLTEPGEPIQLSEIPNTSRPQGVVVVKK
jgi:6-phosphogluconolactonase (cycloisomerase 2 family)